ncbi:hypothetical protein [Edaphosphingomonas haloaromaticamans]|nr:MULTISPECIES: hypothetical protein [Sphingomonas]MDX3886308.1 hypothetical protein [Sphingomonas sp.]
MRGVPLAILAPVVIAAAPAPAPETPRDILIQAAFQTADKATALALIGKAIQRADAILMTDPRNREAAMQRGIAIGYRAKLTRSRSDAQMSRRIFESLAAADPNDAEVQLLIAGWHLDAIDDLGGLVARTALGARHNVGQAALDRAVALAGNRPFFAGMAALMRIRHDDDDIAAARRLAEEAASAPAATPLDRLMKRSIDQVLPALRAGNGKAAQAIARKLLPFGRVGT